MKKQSLFLSLCIALASFVSAQKQIYIETIVNVLPEQAYERWTTEAGLKNFIGESNLIKIEPGGEFEIYFSSSAPKGMRGSEGCKVLSYLPNKMLSFTWNAPPKFARARRDSHKTIVTLLFQPVGQTQTKVSLSHYNWKAEPQWDSVFNYFERAWDNVMTSYSQSFNLTNKATVAMKEYLYKVSLPPRLHDDKKWTEQERIIAGQHFAYLQKSLAEGKVILAGRTSETNDKTFGIIIYRAANDEEAKLFMKNDPAVKAGIMTATFHPYVVSLMEH
jgi:uncharacterized protein YndB with AHSA1/START domain